MIPFKVTWGLVWLQEWISECTCFKNVLDYVLKKHDNHSMLNNYYN